jgi:hypothetical protein
MNKKYIVGIYNDSDNIKNKEIADKSKELTEFFIKHHKGTSKNTIVIEDISVDSILQAAKNIDCDYCLIVSIGQFILDNRFFDHIEKWMQKIDFFVTGHIIDNETDNSHNKYNGGQYWGFHKQCLLVNMNYYKEFKCPKYGYKFINKDAVEVHTATRSSANIHHDYTPIQLKPASKTDLRIPSADGWNLINESLAHNIPVYNFNIPIRTTKQYIYPNKDLNTIKQSVFSIYKLLDSAKNCVFIWNTENYKDVKPINKLEKVFGVAAGFKTNFILNTNGFNSDTEVIYYDYSKVSLLFKKIMIKSFDGEDYPAFCNWAINKYNIPVTTGNSTRDKADYNLWNQELERWGGISNFKNHWNIYKTLPHKYIHVNILDNPKVLIPYMDKEKNTAIWWSNIFYTPTAYFSMSKLQLEDLFINKWISSLNQYNNDNLIILGKDHLNIRVTNNNIKEYIECLQ